ncbi:hypothetical protein [Streptomyces lydicamycinicus]|uniref:hypothetical protein n=1 Tax=Streptomyces lydicamycinicus TaxID=1546107 RepID=UPI003C2BD17C
MSDESLDNVIRLFAVQSERRQAAKSSVEDGWAKWTEIWEAAYLGGGQTLTNPATAASLRVAAAVVNHFLDGACATGSITEEQRDKLVNVIVHTAQVAADEFSG